MPPADRQSSLPLVDPRMCQPEYLSQVRSWLLRLHRIEKASLLTNYRNFINKRERVHGVHYDKPDPLYDAWMLVTFQERLCFDESYFLESFKGTDFQIIYKDLRLKLDIRRL